MKKFLAIIILFFLNISAAQEFGTALLQRIYNKTNFDLSIEYEKSASELIPTNSIVRFESLSTRYLDEVRYFTLKTIDLFGDGSGPNLVLAENNSGKSQKSLFTVTNHLDGDQNNFIKIASKEEPHLFLSTIPSAEDQHSTQLITHDSSTTSDSFMWKIEGSDLSRIFLKNKFTQGYLGPFNQRDSSKSSEKLYLDPDYKQSDLDINSMSLVQALAEARSSSVAVEDLLSLHGRVVGEVIKQNLKKPSDEESDAEPFDFLKDTDVLRTKLRRRLKELLSAEDRYLKYGDVVRLTSHNTMQNLAAVDGEAFCVSSYSHDLVEEGDQLFIVKGPHSEQDRFNCAFGQPVFSSDQIRLEHVKSQKNLSTLKKEEFDNVFDFREFNDIGQPFSLRFNGDFGIGDSSDDWVVSIVDLASESGSVDTENFSLNSLLSQGKKKILMGQEIIFTNVATKSVLQSDNIWQPVGDSVYQKVFAVQVENKNDSDDVDDLAEKVDETSVEGKSVVDSENQEMEANLEIHEMLSSKWFVSMIESSPSVYPNMLRTGYPAGAPFEKVGQDFYDNQQIKVDVIELGQGNIIPRKTDTWLTIPLEKKEPIISGLAKEVIPNFSPSLALNLSPMLGKGVAWIEQSLKNDNQALVTFMVKASDQGDAQIVFGNELSEKYVLKVILGSANNTVSKIVKRVFEDGEFKDQELSVASVSSVPDAGILPGQYLPFWISLNEDQILVGQGFDLGENIFLTAHDVKATENIDRVGFSCGSQETVFTDIRLSDPLQPALFSKPYYSYPDKISVFDDLDFTDLQFRVPSRGAMSFRLSGSLANLFFLQEKNFDEDHYKLSFSDTGFVEFLLFKNGSYSTLGSIKSEGTAIDSDRVKNFWFSFDNGAIFVGQSDIVGENILFTTLDSNPFDLNFIAADSNEDGVFISDVKIGRPVEMMQSAQDYSKGLEEAYFKGKVQVVLPFQYRLQQEDDNIILTDMITKKTFYAARVPQRGAEYNLMLTIKSNGLPQIRWAWQPENEDLLKLKKKSYVFKTIGDALYMTSGHIEGSGTFGQAVGAAFSIAVAGSSIPVSKMGIEAGAEAEFGYKKAQDKRAFIDSEIEKSAFSGFAEKERVLQNQKEVSRLLTESTLRGATTSKDLLRLIPNYLKILDLIVHPYAIKNESSRQSIISGISSLFNLSLELQQRSGEVSELVLYSMSNLLLKAYYNSYLTSAADIADNQKRGIWLGWVTEIFNQLLEQDKNKELKLPKLYGNYIWLKEQSKEAGVSTVTFEAKGVGDLLLGFIDFPDQVLGTNKDFYEIVFGDMNKKSSIGLGSRKGLAVESRDNKISINSVMFRKYWARFNKGTIEVGYGSIPDSSNAVMTWQDPYAQNKERFIGFGSRNSGLTVKNIQLS